MIFLDQLRREKIGLFFGTRTSEETNSITVYEEFTRVLSDAGVATVAIDLRQSNWLRSVSDLTMGLNCCYGHPGEDGSVQGFLDLLGIPYPGSSALSAGISVFKDVTKDILRARGINVPRGLVIEVEKIPALFDEMALPFIVKSTFEGSSFNVFLVEEPKDLQQVMLHFSAEHAPLLVEQYLSGTEVTCGVLQRGADRDDYEVLPIVAMRSKISKILDAESKQDADRHIIHELPARLDPEIAADVKRLALEAHRDLGLEGFSRTDMIIVGNTPYVLEVNAFPGMMPDSTFPMLAAVQGLSYADLVLAMITTAYYKKGVGYAIRSS